MDARLVAYLEGLGATPDALDGWTVHTAQRDGVAVGAWVTKGCEIHIVSFVGQRAMSRRNVREALEPLISTYGYATTRVAASETNHRLREALGFTHTWGDGQYNYFVLTSLPYEKQPEGKLPCQLL